MNVREAFQAQGRTCAALGSPFMGRLMPLIGARLSKGAVADRILGWQGDPSASADSVPLRLAGALHALKIEGIALTDVYPPEDVDDDTLWAALEDAMTVHEARLMAWLDTAPQTNEVRRAAPLIAALSKVAEAYADPVELIELGCSGGLNLRTDHFQVDLGGAAFGPKSSRVTLKPDWTGAAPATPPLPIVARYGVDLSPIDPATTAGRLRLLAYLWPDQPERIAMTDAAIDIARNIPATIAAGDAGAWLETQLAEPAPDRTRVVFHTVAWQYFPEPATARAVSAMEQTESPLVRISMEADGGKGAALTMTHYPSGREIFLGRADFHGRWVHWAA